MKILSWNVQGAFPPTGSPDRITDQLRFIVENANSPDLLLLNEVTTARRELWHEKLEDAGYSEVVDTLDWDRTLADIDVPPFQDFTGVNGNLIAIHDNSELENLCRQTPSIRDPPFDEATLKHWDTNHPQRILNAEVDLGDTTIDLWNVRTVPGNMYGEEKIKILENVYNRILKKEAGPRILAGDFNAPKAETEEGKVIPWRNEKQDELSKRWQNAERNILTGLDEVGMVDVFRMIHGYGDLDTLDVSHPTGDSDTLTGKRFDHLLASRSLNAEDCFYDADGLTCSDHAPIIAKFYPDFSG
ncbi:endonuclease/exonuclease/phosphatase family protein [Salarchaeum sp. JOR-1]|uniref:endonuclease/exonuclease/phosphatase family protein n=1 Tax=Salarchaeum sp. JOR-1 TaxID=2599399 RepID=UPI00119836DC|nr:endonuclease/exonuclease/phosphatase family protein [Salarchaeum sp. JOR-1]QDX40834.1 hypothetical protein FQU85_07935 [Salarchaeum sp. JOR-1]